MYSNHYIISNITSSVI